MECYLIGWMFLLECPRGPVWVYGYSWRWLTISVSQKGSTCGNSLMTQRPLKSFPPPSTAHYSKWLTTSTSWSQENHLQLNSTKCKKIRTCFKRTPPCLSQFSIEGIEFEMISLAKVLGVIISSDLKWSAYINSITTKASKRLYLLRQLKRACIAHNDLVRFHCSAIRSVLEYACQVFHCNLPLYLSGEIERIQRRALRIIFPGWNYNEGLAKAGLPALYDRRHTLCKDLFNKIAHGSHKLSHLLPQIPKRCD